MKNWEVCKARRSYLDTSTAIILAYPSTQTFCPTLSMWTSTPVGFSRGFGLLARSFAVRNWTNSWACGEEAVAGGQGCFTRLSCEAASWNGEAAGRAACLEWLLHMRRGRCGVREWTWDGRGRLDCSVVWGGRHRLWEGSGNGRQLV